MPELAELKNNARLHEQKCRRYLAKDKSYVELKLNVYHDVTDLKWKSYCPY